MKRVKLFALVVTLSLVVTSCATHLHAVGSGPKAGESLEARQWYILWGLVPLNNVDTHAMAGSTQDYQIKTQTSPLDIIMNIFTGIVTVNSRTVTVTK